MTLLIYLNAVPQSAAFAEKSDDALLNAPGTVRSVEVMIS